MKKNYIMGIVGILVIILIIGATFLTYKLFSNSNQSSSNSDSSKSSSDSDGSVSVHIRAENPGASESGEVGTVVLSREGGKISKPLTVSLRLSGIALLGTDYHLTASEGATSTIETSDMYTFPENIQSVTFGVIPIDDSIVENFESIDFSLTWNNIGSVASISIKDND